MSKIQRWYIKPNGVLIHCDDYNKVEENLEEQICKSSDVAALEARALAAEAENMCDACMGTGEPTSGKPCMCGGTGKMSDAAIYLREQLNKDDVEIERLIISRAAIADEQVILRKELDEAQRHWDKSNRQVEPLKAENLQLKLEIAAGRTKDDKLEKENERLKSERLDFENREGAICPEDVGFEEYIKTLKKQVEELELEVATIKCSNSRLGYV